MPPYPIPAAAPGGSPGLSRRVSGLLSLLLVLGGLTGDSAGHDPAMPATSTPAGPPAAPAGEPPQAAGSDSLEKYLDPFFARQMAELHIPGVVFTLVKDGQILTRAYGYQHLDPPVPASPDESLFRIASVSKVFAAVAILQLAEEGKIDLEADVNRYLGPCQVRNPFPRPLRVADLLLHTDGLEERITGVLALDPGSIPPLEQVLQKELPPLVHPPGQMITYGSWGTALASYLVERVSGLPYEEYVASRILRPLGMHRTTLVQDMPPGQRRQVATVYRYEKGRYLASPFLAVTTPATGGGSATGPEMGRFLLALMQRGQVDGARILSPESVEQMFRRQFTPHPGLPGVTYGFFEHVERGHRGLVREGSGVGVNSRIFLLPEQNLAFFIAYNARGSELSTALTTALLERLPPGPGTGGAGGAGGAGAWPGTSGAAGPPPGSEPGTGGAAAGPQMATGVQPPALVSELSGQYRYVQYSRHSLGKLGALLSGRVAVAGHPDGSLTVTPLGMGDPYGGFEAPSRWVPVGPLLFQRAGGQGYLAFGRDGEGRIRYLYAGQGYHGTFERVRWYQTPAFHLAMVAGFLLFFGWMLAAALLGRLPGPGPWLLATRWLAGLTAVMAITLLVAALPVAFRVGAVGGFPVVAFADTAHPLVEAMLALPYLLVVLLLGLTGLTVLGWVGPWAHLGAAGGRLDLAALTLVTGALVGYLRYWQLLR